MCQSLFWALTVLTAKRVPSHLGALRLPGMLVFSLLAQVQCLKSACPGGLSGPSTGPGAGWLMGSVLDVTWKRDQPYYVGAKDGAWASFPCPTLFPRSSISPPPS